MTASETRLMLADEIELKASSYDDNAYMPLWIMKHHVGTIVAALRATEPAGENEGGNKP
jgi:hypothetical protein